MRQAQFLFLALYFFSFFLPVGTSTDSGGTLPLISDGAVLGYRAALGALAMMVMIVSIGLTLNAAALFGLGTLLTCGNLLMLSSLFFLTRKSRPPRKFNILAGLSIVGALVPIPLSLWSAETTKLGVGYYLWGLTIVCTAVVLLRASRVPAGSDT